LLMASGALMIANSDIHHPGTTCPLRFTSFNEGRHVRKTRRPKALSAYATWMMHLFN
jgi:hypothetical protein